jgi:hypothetical protein
MDLGTVPRLANSIDHTLLNLTTRREQYTAHRSAAAGGNAQHAAHPAG